VKGAAWFGLYREQTLSSRVARCRGETLDVSLRNRLNQLKSQGFLEPSGPRRFTDMRRKTDNLVDWYIAKGELGPALRLARLPALCEASLTIQATTDGRSQHLHHFTVMLKGARHDGTTLAIAIHLDNDRVEGHDRMGDGACGHAAFHCHVGPDLDTLPKVRVPLPAISAVDAFDWLLSVVIPGWEPAPWTALPSPPGVTAARP
jgi:hypothetical protein